MLEHKNPHLRKKAVDRRKTSKETVKIGTKLIDWQITNMHFSMQLSNQILWTDFCYIEGRHGLKNTQI